MLQIYAAQVGHEGIMLYLMLEQQNYVAKPQ